MSPNQIISLVEVQAWLFSGYIKYLSWFNEILKYFLIWSFCVKMIEQDVSVSDQQVAPFDRWTSRYFSLCFAVSYKKRTPVTLFWTERLPFSFYYPRLSSSNCHWFLKINVILFYLFIWLLCCFCLRRAEEGRTLSIPQPPPVSLRLCLSDTEERLGGT